MEGWVKVLMVELLITQLIRGIYNYIIVLIMFDSRIMGSRYILYYIICNCTNCIIIFNCTIL